MYGELSEIRSRKSEVRSQESEACLLRSVLCLLSSVFCVYFVVGCQSSDKQALLTEQVGQLTKHKKELTRQIEQSKSENEQLRKQIRVLSELPEEVRHENLYDLQKIKISRYTGLSDEDKDGQIESLIVYLQPIDGQGDIVKTAGAVDVQLWDLNNANGQALLGEWHMEPDELKKHWAAFMVINYRLTFEIADKVRDSKEALTVKVTFTDYLTGKEFQEQRVIKPRLVSR